MRVCPLLLSDSRAPKGQPVPSCNPPFGNGESEHAIRSRHTDEPPCSSPRSIVFLTESILAPNSPARSAIVVGLSSSAAWMRSPSRMPPAKSSTWARSTRW